MGLSTSSAVLIGVSIAALTGAAAVVISWDSPDPEIPVRNERPREAREYTVRDINHKRRAKVVPPIEEADEVVVISESPINFEYTPGDLNPPAAEAPRTQYFGLADPATIDQWAGRWRRGTTTKLPAPSGPGVGSALSWLTEHQHKDGYWQPDLFHEDSKRKTSKRRTSEGADAATRVSVTALAAVAMAYSGRRNTDDAQALAAALKFLVGQMKQDGWIEPHSVYGVQTQALACMAFYGAGQDYADAARRAWDALSASRLPNSGWAVSKSSATPDLFATMVAYCAMQRLEDDKAVQTLVQQGLSNAVRDANAGGMWLSGSESATAACAYVLMDWSDDSHWRGELQPEQRKKLLSDPPLDFQYAWALSWGLKGTELDWSNWARALREKLLESQVGFREGDKDKKGDEGDKRSWEPDASLAATGGRVGSTAMAVLALSMIDNTKLTDPPAEKKDTDKDGSADALEQDGALPTLITTGPGLFAFRQNSVVGVFPLQHTAVRAEIAGLVCSAEVTQTYSNPYEDVIEAVYCFPLPHRGAITDFTLTIGQRVIRGLIRPREQAEKEYTEAVARGQTAALLSGESGGVFNHCIGNIAPGANLDVSVTVFEQVKLENGWHEWAMPLVVGPYYIAGTPVETPEDPGNRVEGHGVEPDTDKVPNASRVTPPTLPKGVISTNEVEINVILEAGAAVTAIESVQHEVVITEPTPSRRELKLKNEGERADRDFILRWQVAHDPAKPALLAHKTEGADGYFTLTLTPPELQGRSNAPREITFVMDVSGSMTGLPIECSKQLVQTAMSELTVRDKFNLFYFSGGSGQLFQQPEYATPENIARATASVENLQAGGGTEMLKGLKHALEADHDDSFVQTYAFLTDGYVGEVDGILQYVAEYGDKVQFFAFGVGQSVNRELIDGVAESGNGRAIYYIPGEELDLAPITAFIESIRSPVAVSPVIDWGGLEVYEVVPGELNNVYAGQTITVSGRYRGEGSGNVRITWKADDVEQGMDVALTLPSASPGNSAVAQLWCSRMLHELETGYLSEPHPERLKRMVELAVEHRLATRWTSFVAIDGESKVDGKARTVVQPVELPKGVSRDGVGR